MRKFLCMLPVLVLVLLPFPACAHEAESEAAAVTLETEDDKTLYALGLAISQGLGQFGLTEDELATVQEGLADGVLERDAQVDLQEYGPKLQAFAQQRATAAVAAEREEGKKLVTDAAAAEGAETSESGLVFTSLEEGTGPSPKATDTVQVHYTGTLRDGSTFDSSVERGTPATFPLNQVIPCWTEGLQKVKVGGKAKLVCPPDIGYGDQPRPGIPAGSTLIFEVELLDIVTQGAAPAAPAEEGSGEGR